MQYAEGLGLESQLVPEMFLWIHFLSLSSLIMTTKAAGPADFPLIIVIYTLWYCILFYSHLSTSQHNSRHGRSQCKYEPTGCEAHNFIRKWMLPISDDNEACVPVDCNKQGPDYLPGTV